MIIGKQVRALRKARKLTLVELAEKSGVQIATLSRIENFKMTGTLESHMQIAKALGIDVTELYRDITQGAPPSETVPAHSHSERFTYNDKASYEILANKVLAKKMMPVVLKIDPGGQTNPEENQPGSEKFIFVLEGEITVYVGDKAHPLPRANALYIDASVSHYFVNTGRGPAKVISVVTPVAL